MELGLRGKVVFITGGSKGIGLSCARAFLDEGAKVALVSRGQSNLDAALAKLNAASGQALAVAADLKDAAATAAAVAKAEAALGAIDVLVNSAGAAKRYLPAELSASSWHDAMDAKYFTYIHTMDAVLPRMAARGGGVVVNIIGMGGKVATPYHLPGGAANSALMLATVGLANVYGPKGIRVNAINPAATMTDRVQEALKLEAKMKNVSEQEVLAQGQAKVPLGRYAAPEDVAHLTVFLASDKASYITGALIPMDGGANPLV